MMNTWQTTATVTCICHYLGPQDTDQWPLDWVTRLHNIIIISVAALHLSISSTPGQGCFVQAAADLSIVVNCSNSLFFVRLKYCAGHQRGSERGDDGKMFTDKIQIKSLHHSLLVTARQSAPQTISIKIINTQNQARADKIVNLPQRAGKWLKLRLWASAWVPSIN